MYTKLRAQVFLLLMVLTSFWTVQAQQDSVKIPDFSSRYNIKNLGLNSEKDDFAPTYFKDGILFVTDRAGGRFFKSKKKHYYDIFYSHNDDMHGAVFSRPVEFYFPENTKYHHGPSSYCDETEVIYLTIDNMTHKKHSKDGRNDNYAIYEANASSTTNWGNLKKLPFCKNEFSYAYPSISADGKTLFFVTNEPLDGAQGGFDIYMVQKTANGQWSDPVNMGKYINTEKDEISPFIHKDKTLYFASEGHKGAGGFDIYEAAWHEGHYAQISNVGYPINTSANDYGLVLHEDKRIGFFNSDREGGKGMEDIYELDVTLLSESRLLCDHTSEVYGIVTFFVTGIVMDKESNEPLSNAVIRIIDETNGEIQVVKSNKKGVYKIQIQSDRKYKINTFKKGYHSVSNVKVNTYDKHFKENIKLDLAMKSKNFKFEVVGLVTDVTTKKVITNASVWLKSNKDAEQPIKIQTDEKGMYRLSMKQERTYKIWANAKGYEKGRTFLIPTVNKSASEVMHLNLPLKAEIVSPYRVACRLQDVKTDTTVSMTGVRLIDWRTRKVLKESFSDDKGNVTFDLDSGKIYLVEVRSETYEQVQYIKVSSYNIEKFDTKYINVPLRGIYKVKKEPVDAVPHDLVIPPVYYQKKDEIISSQLEKQLDATIAILKKYPKVKIGIASYTDSNGERIDNKKLSVKRAFEVHDYLVFKGIKSYRIVYVKGLGETGITNGCNDGVECSDEQHKQNRRTEFVIIR